MRKRCGTPHNTPYRSTEYNKQFVAHLAAKFAAILRIMRRINSSLQQHSYRPHISHPSLISQEHKCHILQALSRRRAALLATPVSSAMELVGAARRLPGPAEMCSGTTAMDMCLM